MKNLHRGFVLLMIVFCFLVSSVGCFGRFQLTRSVYQFNRTIHHDKWVKEAAFLVMNFVPIYGVAVWLDAVIINSIEFWTGQNPFYERRGRAYYGPNGEEIHVTIREDGRMSVMAINDLGEKSFFVLERRGEDVVALDSAGNLLAQVTEVNGELQLVR